MSRWPDNRFLQLVGATHPIIQAPMANGGGVELCIAAIEGGALGSLPCGMLTDAQISEQVGEVRRRVSGPINLNFLCHRMPDGADHSAWRALLQPYYKELGIEPAGAGPTRLPFDEAACAAVEELRSEVVSFHYGLPPAPLLDRVKAAGAIILSSATTVAEARWLEEHGSMRSLPRGLKRAAIARVSWARTRPKRSVSSPCCRRSSMRCRCR